MSIPLSSISAHLMMNGFRIGLTNTGFVAVDCDGIVFTCSKFRTSVQVCHPQTGHNRIEYLRSIPSKEWCDKHIDEFTIWTQDPKAKAPPRIVKMSNRPVPSQLANKINEITHLEKREMD